MSNDPVAPGSDADDLLGRWFAYHGKATDDEETAAPGHRLPIAARPSEAAAPRATRPSASAALAELREASPSHVGLAGVTAPSTFGARRRPDGEVAGQDRPSSVGFEPVILRSVRKKSEPKEEPDKKEKRGRLSRLRSRVAGPGDEPAAEDEHPHVPDVPDVPVAFVPPPVLKSAPPTPPSTPTVPPRKQVPYEDMVTLSTTASLPVDEPEVEPVLPGPDTEPTPIVPEPEPTPVVPEPEPTPVVPEPEPEPVVPEPEPQPEVEPVLPGPDTEPTPIVPVPEPTPAVPEPTPEPTPVVPDPEPEPVPEPTPVVPEPTPVPEPEPVLPGPDTPPAPLSALRQHEQDVEAASKAAGKGRFAARGKRRAAPDRERKRRPLIAQSAPTHSTGTGGAARGLLAAARAATPAPVLESQTRQAPKPLEPLATTPLGKVAEPSVPGAEPMQMPAVYAFTPRRSVRRFLSLMLVVGLAASGYLGYTAYLSRESVHVGVAGIAVVVTMVIWAIRAGATVIRLTVRSGQLEIVKQGNRLVFDLASTYTAIEVVGKPGSKKWKVQFLRRGLAPVVVDATMVDGRDFMRVLRFFRPELA